ncbi:MAG: hypothetical protein KDJ48_14685 [Nitratireductor sp.]|nr:hypothetical protein [Nitratireductor sp.]
MHIILFILGVAGAAAFWWYRLKYLGQAANEAADAVGRVRGSIRRSAIRKKAALSPLTAIDDPVVAAATIMTAILCEDRPVTPGDDQRIRDAIASVASPAKVDEAVIYAKWAFEQIGDTGVVIDKVCPFLKSRLNENEREQLVDMVLSAASGDRSPQIRQRVDRLRQKLGLVVH